MRIENAGRTFHDEAMQIGRPDCLAKCFAESVQEIENKSLFDLDFLVRSLERPDRGAIERGRLRTSRRGRPPAARERRNGHMRDGQVTSLSARDAGLVLSNRGRL